MVDREKEEEGERQTHVWGTNRASAGLTDNGNGLVADECQRE